METNFQLQLQANSFVFYLLVFSVTIVFYTRAYLPLRNSVANTSPRTNWYRENHRFVRFSQLTLLIISAFAVVWSIIQFKDVPRLKGWQWLVLVSLPLVALLYYGFRKHAPGLRRIGWLKPLLIGYVWAGTVNVFPVSYLLAEEKSNVIADGFMQWLFIKNWMFCTANAILFDLKDYANDANKQVKTFVVQWGLRTTLFLIILPLLLIGFLSFIIFSYYNRFPIPVVLINAIPFLLLLYIAFTMQKRKAILYYLVVIDGVLLVKACCGIAGSLIAA